MNNLHISSSQKSKFPRLSYSYLFHQLPSPFIYFSRLQNFKLSVSLSLIHPIFTSPPLYPFPQIYNSKYNPKFPENFKVFLSSFFKCIHLTFPPLRQTIFPGSVKRRPRRHVAALGGRGRLGRIIHSSIDEIVSPWLLLPPLRSIKLTVNRL